MIGAVAWGCLAGTGFVAISEAILSLWKRRPEWKPMQAALIGMAARTAWMLAVLAVGMAQLDGSRAGFAAALLSVYLTAQVAEGFRYRKFAESKGSR